MAVRVTILCQVAAAMTTSTGVKATMPFQVVTAVTRAMAAKATILQIHAKL